MSKFKATVSYVIDSDNLSEESITAYFDNQGDEAVEIEVEDDECSDGMGSMNIVSADATVEVIEY